MSYPRLVINRQKLKDNVTNVLEMCKSQSVEVVGVIKGVNALDGIIKVLIDSGFQILASSRISQLKKVKEINPKILTYDLRIPMLSEVESVITYADISLNSSLCVMKALNQEAYKQGKIHNVIIMVECGDLREGIYNENELCETALIVEKELKNLHLMGIGTNLGCYGSIMPTPEKMNELICKAQIIEDTIGRKLEVVSGAASTAFPLIAKKTMPKGITQLRIGDALYVSDLDECFDYTMYPDYQEPITLEAEIIEVMEKPSYPIGTIAVDAFGNKKEYIDKGIRKRALVAVGRQDIGDCHHLKPLDTNIQIMGGSSDHTILDINDCDTEYKIGDIVKFHLMYENLLMSTQSSYVEKVFE